MCHRRSDASSSHLQFYRPLKDKAEDPMGHNDPQFPDLSAFLSQEELDESVNLARQAIGHESREERAEVKAPVTPSAHSNIYSCSASSSETPSVPLANRSPAPSIVPFCQPPPESIEMPAAHLAFTSDRKMLNSSKQQDSVIRNSRDSSERVDDFNRMGKNTTYGPETQSKKEFLNKAADFIEELSSLFKANSSKRIRPRSCKAHRSRNQHKIQNDGTLDPLSRENRERFQDRITEELQGDSVSQDVAEEAESCALKESPYPSEPVCEPPHFIQKLKSREVQEGSKVQLDCAVRGFPVPEVR
uniref:Ig-like domain-containing protein n=1 Tax=Mola mola TaxID=94237 RepID=A0A3Q3W981_MOLML